MTTTAFPVGVAAILAVLAITGPASADPPLNSDKTTADDAAAQPVGVEAGQISQVDPRKHGVDSGQLSTSGRDAGAAAAAQLSAHGHSATSAQIAAPAARRNTQVSPIIGQDRCDPTAPTAKQPECTQILDQRGDDFAGRTTDNTPSTVDSNTSGDLVNGIVSSGTGTVVQLPRK